MTKVERQRIPCELLLTISDLGDNIGSLVMRAGQLVEKKGDLHDAASLLPSTRYATQCARKIKGTGSITALRYQVSLHHWESCCRPWLNS
jgi:hypothetical protein